MNKKVIMLIVVIVLIAIIGGIVMISNQNKTEGQNANTNTENTGTISNEDTKNETENAISNANNNTALAQENNNQNTESTGKILIVYFSQSGNTEAVANIIHDSVGGDIVKLETVQTYPSDYNELVDYAQKEQNENARPELKDLGVNVDDYDTIFLGYPNWWGDMPMPLYTFLDNYDLSGKTIAPFITHGGSGLSGTPAKIKNEEPNATVTEGLAVSGSQAKNSQSTVQNWLSQIGF